MDKDDLILIYEDIIYLKQKWFRPLSKTECRHGSSVLRRLLVENELGRAWRELGFSKEPIIIAMNLDLMMKDVPKDKIVIVQSVGGPFNGGWCLMKGSEVPPCPKEKCDQFQFPLSQFLKSSGIITRDHIVTRLELIQYLANIGGGVHIGKSSRKSEKLLRKKIEKVEKAVLRYRNEGLYTEIRSIGQCIAASPDINRLLDNIRMKVQ